MMLSRSNAIPHANVSAQRTSAVRWFTAAPFDERILSEIAAMTETVVVVGAGPGIGMATARRFGAEGYKVALLARHEDAVKARAEELRASGTSAAAFAVDVADIQATTGAIAEARRWAGGELSALVYNAFGWA